MHEAHIGTVHSLIKGFYEGFFDQGCVLLKKKDSVNLLLRIRLIYFFDSNNVGLLLPFLQLVQGEKTLQIIQALQQISPCI